MDDTSRRKSKDVDKRKIGVVIGGMALPYMAAQLSWAFSEDELRRIAIYERTAWAPGHGDIGDDAPERESPRVPVARFAVSFASGYTTTVQAHPIQWFGPGERG